MASYDMPKIATTGYMNTQSAETEMPPVSRLIETVSSLSCCVDEAEKRLSAMLRNSHEVNSINKPGSVPVAPRSAHRSAIEDTIERIHEIEIRLRMMIQRVDL